MFSALITSAILSSLSAPQEAVVVEANVTTTFAGKLGRRILTDLTIETDGVRRTFRVDDVRHTKFQKASSPYLQGMKVRVIGRRVTTISL